MYPIGWFSTGRDRAARQLLTAVRSSIERGQIEAEILFVFSNREEGQAEESDLFFELVEDYEIPLIRFSSRGFLPEMRRRGLREGLYSHTLREWRLLYDREVVKRLKGFQPELCVLVGYMLIVGQEMCRRYSMINLHPAAPGGPVGTWQEVIWQLIEARARGTGVTMHLVTEELDEGPPVTYCRFPIRGEPFDELWREIEGRSVGEIRKQEGEANLLFKLIRKYGVERELPLIIATIAAFAQGRLSIEAGNPVAPAGEIIGGLSLSQEIERSAARRRREKGRGNEADLL